MNLSDRATAGKLTSVCVTLDVRVTVNDINKENIPKLYIIIPKKQTLTLYRAQYTGTMDYCKSVGDKTMEWLY